MQIAIETKEVGALIRLLEDPDDGVFRNVSSRLISLGRVAIPFLEYEWESNVNYDIQSRIEDIIHRIQFEGCKTALSSWKQAGGTDLFKGALIVSLYRFPDLNPDHCSTILEQYRKDVWLELNDHLTSLEKVRVINHILFDVHGIKPCLKHHVSAQSSFLPNLLELHKGSPTTLSILYMALAEQLNLPIVGIDLPHHFILGYMDAARPASKEILFYINPYSRGAVFGKGELERYMEKMDIDSSIQNLRPASNIRTIARLLSDISSVYEKSGEQQKMNEIDELLLILDTEN